RPDEGHAAAVLDVARLLADEHHTGRDRTLPEDDPGRIAPEGAAPARPRRPALLVEPLVGSRRRGGHGRVVAGLTGGQTTALGFPKPGPGIPRRPRTHRGRG